MKNKNLSGNLFTKTPLVESERSLSKWVSEYLDKKNIYHLRLNAGGKAKVSGTAWITLCPKGTPDRFFIYKGFHIFLEFKKKGEKPTKDQIAVHNEIKNQGGFVKVIDNKKDLINLIKWIEDK